MSVPNIIREIASISSIFSRLVFGTRSYLATKSYRDSLYRVPGPFFFYLYKPSLAVNLVERLGAGVYEGAFLNSSNSLSGRPASEDLASTRSEE